jgi:hypothetical protein
MRDGAPTHDEPAQAGGFSASEKIWSFFAEHARGRRSSNQPPVFKDDGQEQV